MVQPAVAHGQPPPAFPRRRLVSAGAVITATAPAHQGLSGWLRDPEAVVSVELGQLMAARQDWKLQLVISLEQQTQSQRVSLSVQEVRQHCCQVCHNAFSCEGMRCVRGEACWARPSVIHQRHQFSHILETGKIHANSMRGHTTILEGRRHHCRPHKAPFY